MIETTWNINIPFPKETQGAREYCNRLIEDSGITNSKCHCIFNAMANYHVTCDDETLTLLLLRSNATIIQNMTQFRKTRKVCRPND